MSTKKIKATAASKLQGKAEPSFSATNPKEPQSMLDGLVAVKKQKMVPTSFRLSYDDIQNLKKITKDVNAESKHKISETRVIKALIQIGSKIPAAEVINALGEII